MKKFFLMGKYLMLASAFCLGLSLTACGDDDDDDNKTPEVVDPSDEDGEDGEDEGKDEEPVVGVYSPCFVKDANTGGEPAAAKAEGGVFKVTSPAGAAQDWDTQFWIGLPQTLEAGAKYAVTFEYKADVDVAIDTQAHGEPGDYHHYAAVGTLNFTSDWQKLEFEGEVEDAQATGGQGDGYKTIAFNLSKDKENDVNFEIKNITVTVK